MVKLVVDDINIEVLLKDIRNVHLRVYPPDGYVRISAPRGMEIAHIRAFALSKLDWIRSHRSRLLTLQQENTRQYASREVLKFWGNDYSIQIIEHPGTPLVRLGLGTFELFVRPGTSDLKRKAIVEQWYRDEIKSALLPLLDKWQPRLGVKIEKFFVRRMKTKWGSCNYRAHSIRLNTELARKPAACFEYVVVHELVHLLEPSHNARFKRLMTKFMPNWKSCRQELNRLPIL